ncbi:MAG: sulfatase [Acidobacteriota bacterium]
MPQEGEPLGIVWADAEVSELGIPIAVPMAETLVIRLLPLNCDGCSPQSASVLLNGRHLANLDLGRPGFRDYPVHAPADAFRYGQNILRFEWGRITSPSEFDRAIKTKNKLAAALVSVSLHPVAGRSTVSAPPAFEDQTLRVGGDEAAVFYLRIPEGARLAGTVSRDPSSAFGAAGTARISVKVDEREEEVALLRGLSALGSRRFPFTIDLAPYAGRVARLSLRCDRSDPASSLVARFDDLRLCAAETIDAGDAFGVYRRQPLPPTPPAVPSSRPNVLLYLMDALRARTLSCYGALEVTSPFLDKLSREGATLTAATSQASNTPPNVKALLTGKYLPYTGKSPLRAADTSMAEIYKKAGYATAALACSPWPAALAALRGFDIHPRELYAGSRDDWWNLESTPPKYYAREMYTHMRAWAAQQSDPIFVYAHSLHPHNPYSPPEPWSELDAPSKLWDFNGNSRYLLDIQYGHIVPDAKQIAELLRLYRLDVLYNDYEIGRSVAALKSLGRWDDSLFLFIADHGDEFYEHKGIMHGFTSYSELIEIPFVLRSPGRIPAGVLVTAPHETIDAAPTLLSLSGLAIPPDADGTPVRFEPPDPSAPPRRTYSSCSGIPGIYTIADRGWKYVYAPRDNTMVGIGEGASRVKERFYLYDLRTDAQEAHNLFSTHPVLSHYLHRSIQSWLRATGDTPDPQSELDEETKAVLESLGYLDASVTSKPLSKAGEPGSHP